MNPDRPPVLDGIRIDQMPDTDLEALVAPGSPVFGDDRAVDLVLAEIDRRDDAARAAQEGNTFLAACLTVRNSGYGTRSVAELGRQLDRTWSDTCAQIDAMIFGDAGKIPTRIQRAAHQLLGSRRASAPTRQEQRAAAEADWRALMAQRYLDAEEYCRGRMLNRASENRGLDERKLFTENAAWVRAHASREYLDWLAENPRITRAEYLVQAGVATDSIERQAAVARESARSLVI